MLIRKKRTNYLNKTCVFFFDKWYPSFLFHKKKKKNYWFIRSRHTLIFSGSFLRAGRWISVNNLAHRRGRAQNCWRSENVREFYFSEEERVLQVGQVGDGQVEWWTSTKEPTSSLRIFFLLTKDAGASWITFKICM